MTAIDDSKWSADFLGQQNPAHQTPGDRNK